MSRKSVNHLENSRFAGKKYKGMACRQFKRMEKYAMFSVNEDTAKLVNDVRCIRMGRQR